jgi:hypothetical protein
MSERCGAERRRAKQGSVKRNSSNWWMRAVQCVALCAALGACGIAFAQPNSDPSDSAKPADSSDSDPDGTPTTTAPKPTGPAVNPAVINGRPKSGFGIQASGGASVGDGVQQYRSLAPFEALPYYIWDTSMIFSDVRVFPTFTGNVGGNLGGGYRYYDYRLDRIFGVNLWYDADNTHPVGYFQQLGLGLESYGEAVDWRSNFYLPVGNTQLGTGAVALPNSVRFSGNSILYDQSVNSFTAMRGLDMEAGLAIPGKFARERGLRVYGGWYHFEGDNIKSFTGGKGRIQANIYSGLDASVQVMSDPMYQTRIFGAVTWTFGALHRSRLSQATVFGRIGERIQRNYTVVAPQQTYIQHGVEAIDPTTRKAYVVEHVSSSAAAGGDGTAANPFQTLAQAQAAGGNVIFVSANSVFNGADASITLRPNEHLLGDGGGVTHFLQFAGVGAVALPDAPGGGALPVLNGSLGNAITLASGSQVSGFTINSPSGNGIYGNGITNASISNVSVTGAGNDGILLQNSNGTINVFNSSFANATTASMQVLGGAALVNFSGTLGNSTGYDLLVQNTTGGLVDLSGGTITDNGGAGVFLNNNAGAVHVGSLSVANGTGSGIRIDGGTGGTSFLQNVNISNSAGPAVNIANLGTGATVNFSKDVNITGRQAAGVLMNNDAGTTNFNGNVTVGNPNNASASALSITNSSGNFNFNNTVNVTGATGSPGVNLVSNTGTTLFSTLNITSNGGTALFANNAGNLGINANGNIGRGVISSVNGTALDLENSNVQAIFQSVSANGGTVGINMLNTTGYLTVNGNQAQTAGSGGTIQNMTTGMMLNNVGNVGLAFMNFDKNGTAINSIKANHLELQTLNVTNSTTAAITSLDTTTLIVNNSKFSANGVGPTISAQVDQIGSYAYSVTATQILTSTGDSIYINSLPAGAGSTLNLALQNNDIENSGVNEAGLRMNWAGPIVANIDHNQFVASAGSNVGVLINGSSTTALSNIAITNNIFSSTGTAYTGLGVTAAGPSQIAVSGNSIGFGATGGTGMNFTLAGSNQLAITNNGIVDTTDGATGIFFNSVTTPGSIQIDGNTISLANSGGLIDRGIIFQGVSTSTTSPTLSLVGTVNNVINGADTPWFIPLSVSTGQILVNGTPVP